MSSAVIVGNFHCSRQRFKRNEDTASQEPKFELWTSSPLDSEALTARGEFGVEEVVQRLNEASK